MGLSSKRHGPTATIHPMTRTSQTRIEPEIEALLSIDASDSIVDRLMSLPDADAPDSIADEWDRAVAASLQSKLARSLRQAIENASRHGEPSDGRDAA